MVLVLGVAPQASGTNSTFQVTDDVWGTTSTPIQVGAGDQNVPLTVSMQYLGTETATSLTAVIFLPAGISDPTGSPVATARAFNILSNSVFQFVFNLDLTSAAQLGTFAIPMTITYSTPSSPTLNSLASSLSFSLVLAGKTALTFSSPNSTLQPGQVDQVQVILSNTGTGGASQVSISATPPASVSILSVFSAVGSLGAKSTATQTMSIFVPSSAQGSAVSFTFAASYKDPYGNPQTTIQTVGYHVSAPQSSFTITASPQTLTGNALNPVIVSLINTGNSTLNQLVLTVSNQATATLINSDGKLFLGNLAPGQIAQPQIKLFVASSAPSTLSVPVTVSYRDSSGASVSEGRGLNFLVSLAQSNYDIRASTASLVSGEQTPVVLSLENAGSSAINNMVVTLIDQSPITVAGGDGRYNIGSLAPGTVISINTTLYLSPSVSSQVVSLPISVSYRDASGVAVGETRTVSFFAVSARGIFVLLNAGWGDPANPVEVGPGDTSAKLSLTLQYFGSTTVTSLHGILALPSSFTDQKGVQSGLAYATNIVPSSVFVLSFSLDVAPDARVSAYAIPLRLDWNDSLSIGRSANMIASIPLNGRVDIAISAPNSGLSPGKVNTVNLDVTNKGTGPASQLQFSATLLGGSILSQVGKIQFVAADSAVMTSVDIFVPQSSAGQPLSLSLGMSFYDSYGNPRIVATSVGLFVQSSAISLSPLTIGVAPRALLAGQLNNMTIEVVNTGSQALNNLSVSFSSSSTGLTWISPTLLQLTLLTPGQNVSAPASVYVNAAAPDSSTLQLNIKYFDTNNNLNQETRNFGLLTKGVVDLLLQDASTIPQQPSVGQIFSITGTITNIGTTAANGLEVTPQLGEGFTIFGSQSVFVGDVAVNTPTTFTVTLSASAPVGPGSYMIPLRLTYLDNLRETISSVVTVPVSIVAASNSTTTGSGGGTSGQGRASGGSFGLVIPAIVGVIALVAGFLVARRRYSRK